MCRIAAPHRRCKTWCPGASIRSSTISRRIIPLMQQGQVRALAVTSAKRTPAAPDLPTLAEAAPARFRCLRMVRAVRAGQDPARDRAEDACRHRCRAGRSRDQGAAGTARTVGGRLDTRGAWTISQIGNGQVGTGHQGGRHQPSANESQRPATNRRTQSREKHRESSPHAARSQPADLDSAGAATRQKSGYSRPKPPKKRIASLVPAVRESHRA